MEGHKHFSHPHYLSFHRSLKGPQVTCTGCNFPCTDNPVYSCSTCKFYLHDQCFNASGILTHPSHRAHTLSLFPSPTYPSGSFICGSCNQIGSGMCFCCSICEFDIHVHCAYNELKPKSGSSFPPNQIQLGMHTEHPLRYLTKPPYPSDADRECTCDVCGSVCDANDAIYNCGVCGFDAHVECTKLRKNVQREDHEHVVSLLLVKPDDEFECDVCRGDIKQNHYMYFCKSGCDYGMHVQCVEAEVSEKAEKAPMNALTVQLELFKLQNKVRLNQMALNATAFRPNYYY